MKTTILFFSAMLIAFGICACDKKEHTPLKISTNVLKAFNQRYPQAVRVTWEKEGKYYVAEFKSQYSGAETGIITPGLYEMEAWFDSNADWKMTITEIFFNLLPAEVKGGFSTCTYSDWRVEDTNVIERNGEETIYSIEVEKGKDERCLHFNSRGELVKQIKGSDNNYRELL